MGLYLITGGCGFIGSHLADSLVAAGQSVRILDNLTTGTLANKPPTAELIEADVADPDQVAEAMRGCDGCFHLAAVASVERGNQEWVRTHRTNLTGTIVVFNAARRATSRGSIPVVYASSAAVYGDNTNGPLSEEAATRPVSAYGADKLGSEQHAFVAGRVHGVPTCGLRFFNVYGPRQDPASPYSGVISIFCDRLKVGREITIFGDGEQTRDFVYVDDVVRALQTAMARASTYAPVLNVCTGRATSLLQLVQVIAAELRIVPEVRFGPARAGEVRHSVGDPTRARHVLNFLAETDLQNGVALLVRSSTQ